MTKPKYRRTWPKRAREMAAKGILEKEMARVFKVHHTTFSAYKKEHPELAEAIEDGYAEIVEQVEAALIKTALGYEYEETEEKFIVTADGQVSGTKEVKLHKRKAQPNQKALEFFLTNKSDEWRRKNQVEHSGKVEGGVTLAPILNFKDMTPAEEPSLAEFIEQQQQKGKENAE